MSATIPAPVVPSPWNALSDFYNAQTAATGPARAQAQIGLTQAQGALTGQRAIGASIQNRLTQGRIGLLGIGGNAPQTPGAAPGPPTPTSAPMPWQTPPPSGGGIATAGQPGGAQQPFTGPGGVWIPGLGAVPQSDAYGWMGNGDNAQVQKSKAIKLAQMTQQAFTPDGRVDPAAFNQVVYNAFQEGLIDNNEAAHWYGHPEIEQAWQNSTLQPNEMPQVQGAQAAAKAQADVGPAIQTAAGVAQAQVGPAIQRAAGEAAAKAPYADVIVSVPTGQVDSAGMPIMRSQQMNRAQWAQYSQANPGARLETAADRGNSAVTISPDVFVNRLVQHESGGNYQAQAQTSSAGGGAQFTEGTWADLMKSRPDLTQGKTPAQISAMRLDNSPAGKALQNEMALAYARQNAPLLAQAGLPVTSLTLGLAHGWGPQGAQTILNAPPNTPITPALVGSAAYQANPQWQGKTVGDVQADAFKAYGVNQVDLTPGAAAAASAPGQGAAQPVAGPTQATAAPAAAPGIPGQVQPTPTQTTAAPLKADLFKNDSEELPKIQGAASVASQAQSSLLQAKPLIAPAITGAGANLRLAYASVLRTIAPSMVDSFMDATGALPKDATAATEELNKLFFNNVTNAETQLAGPGASVRIGAMLTKLTAQANPSINMQKPALTDMVNMLLVRNQMVKDYANGAAQFFNDNAIPYMNDPLKKPYTPLNNYHNRYEQTGTPESVNTYVAATEALNGKPATEWQKGLSPQQVAAAAGVAARADPVNGGVFNRKGVWVPASVILRQSGAPNG